MAARDVEVQPQPLAFGQLPSNSRRPHYSKDTDSDSDDLETLERDATGTSQPLYHEAHKRCQGKRLLLCALAVGMGLVSNGVLPLIFESVVSRSFGSRHKRC